MGECAGNTRGGVREGRVGDAGITRRGRTGTMGDGDALRRAPALGSRFRGNDGGGGREGRRVGATLRQAQGERTRLVPLGFSLRRNVEGWG